MKETRTEWLKDAQLRLDRKNAFDASLVVGTARFNRDTGRDRMVRQPFAKFIDPATNLIQLDMTRSRVCPVCGAPPGRALFVKDGFRHVHCESCDLIYVSLILREDILTQYWREEMVWKSVLKSEPQLEMDILKFGYGLDLAAAYLGEERDLLDIGAGNGDFVLLAQERDWRAVAMELNLESAASLESAGIKVIVKSLELSDIAPGSFSLITMWEVLEHLTEPKTILYEVHRILPENGILLILVPNVGSLVTRLLHERSDTFGGHSHLNHFNQASLTKLLNLMGFEILEMETVITELGAINNYLSFADPYLGEAPPFSPTLTPDFIHENLWGSRLLVLARPAKRDPS
ncbi:MAG: methyltransferase domain-containing protein [Deltaproteobacteria bacterium]|jgi:2-polyprenyl-3-methyl-5-hydroxy-6-metoxy-1,4-benzoquinol methylase|nr:methyltransferase domain-containing protein [Deltaproteobacteria bacterium]